MYASAAYPQPIGLRQRAASLLLALLAAALIVLALVKLGVVTLPEREPSDEPNSFTLSPDAEEGPRAPASQAAERERAAAAEPEPAIAAPPARPEPPPEPIPEPPPRPSPVPGMIILDRGEFARSDIGARRGEGERTGGEAGAGTGDSVAAYGPGEGPGGQRLYQAEWHREPARAELAGYLPPSGAPQGAWAVIACRTAPNFEVENCRSLGESPAGSGLARAMRQAAWQFRVRPPRIGGRTLVGAWVRIRISFDRAD